MARFDIYLKPNGLSKIGGLYSSRNEFSTELYDKVFDTDDNILYDSYSYPSRGVELDVVENDCIKLIYKGDLAKGEPKEVYAVVSYSNEAEGKEPELHSMQPVKPHVFELVLSDKDSRCLNISFKDSKGNLDDNSGKKYAFCSHHFRKEKH